MNIVTFTREHIANAKKLALSCYQEEQSRVSDLPGAEELTDLTYFADNGLGAAAYEGNTMTGFLCSTEPFDHAFGSTDSKGIFSPMGTHAHITAAYCLSEHRGKGVFQNLLNHAAKLLKKEGYAYLGVDYESLNPTAYAFWQKYFSAYTHGHVRRIDEHILQVSERI